MTAGVPSASTPIVPLKPVGAAQNPDNRAEQVLVTMIAEKVAQTLTDRAGGRHEFPWSPDQNVRVGVLSPEFPRNPVAGAAGGGGDSNDQDDADGDGDTAPPVDGPGANGPTRPAVATVPAPPPVEYRGALGLDFVVDNDAPTANTIELDITVDYAIYQPVLPTHGVINALAADRMKAFTPGGRRRAPRIRVNPSWERDNRHMTVRVPVTLIRDEGGASSAGLPGDALAADAHAAVIAHYARADALRQLANNMTIDAAEAMGSESDYVAAIAGRADAGWTPSAPIPRITVDAYRTADGEVAVSVSFTNAAVVNDRSPQDMAMYDARMSVQVASGWQLVPQRLNFAEGDTRYDQVATVAGRGRGCVALEEAPNGLRAETLPLHTQHVSEPNVVHGASMRFADIAADPFTPLDLVAGAMRRFHREWDNLARTHGADPTEQLQLKLKDDFVAEIDRFELGIDRLRGDARLLRAFTLMNTAFENAATRPDPSWRLFQLVFVVSQLGALAARENPGDARLQAEIDIVDVLWFPTGGGKTEAYLGLILVGMFYDRLRGKTQGISAWLLFPLRMLSVQQLARLLRVVHYAEDVRVTDGVGGSPFSVGYFVGAANTPNRLTSTDGWWPGLDAFARWAEANRDARRLVGACPKCNNGDSVGLDVDLVVQRLLHVCRNKACGYQLPIHASDDEVLRYLATVVVSTVDKITAFARNGELTAINHGPRMQCPQHGFFSHDKCIANACTNARSWVAAPAFHDPPPALWVQDELHLVREELGVFAAHYHTLIAELSVGAGHRPSKIITATATIEQFQDQLSQVYGRNPRLYPSGGPVIGQSFYAGDTDNVRRVYLGVLPAGGGTVKVDLSGAITTQILDEIHALSLNPSELVNAWAAAGMTYGPADAGRILFDYELALAYVNSKAHGVHIADDIGRLTDQWVANGHGPVVYSVLTGDTSLGELAATINQVQSNQSTTPPYERVRALVATSVVSHGVDLDRLNFEVVAGMPSSYAAYIQITARAGRTHVGLVIPVFDRGNRREASMYHSFATTHAALDRMVEPVPVNRFATNAARRTLPGIVCALLWDETRNPSWPSTDSIAMTRKFRPWWNTHAATILPVLNDRIRRALSTPVSNVVNDIDQDTLADEAVRRWNDVERPRMQNWQDDFLTGLFTVGAMTSLRDVDVSVEFGVAGPRAGVIQTRIVG